MGIFQPGGAGTALNVYDDNNGAGGHTVGSPHTWAEINAAFPLDFAILQTAAGATFAANRRQYLCVQELTIGDPGGGGNATSLVDTNADIYSPNGTGSQSRLRFGAVASAGAVTMNLGTKIGTGVKADGKDGCNLYAGSSTLRFRGNFQLYGCAVIGQGGVQLQTAGSATGTDIAGSKFQAAGLGYILGDGGSFFAYNSSFAYAGTGTFMTNCVITDSYNVLLSATAPAFFFSTSAIGLKKLNRVTLNGAVTNGDLRILTSAGGWEAADLLWSDTPGKPRLTFSTPHDVTQGLTDYRTIDTKVVDERGNSLQAVPVQVMSDVDGLILDTQTGFDGQIVFTFNPTGQANVLPVREYYDPIGNPPTSSVITRDRLYTMTVNGVTGTFPANQGYKTRQFKFRWAGYDLLAGADSPAGGSFKKILDVIQLTPGMPGGVTVWEELELAVD